jgi:hypothetical protein
MARMCRDNHEYTGVLSELEGFKPDRVRTGWLAAYRY